MDEFIQACRMLSASGQGQPLYVDGGLYDELGAEIERLRDQLSPWAWWDGEIVLDGCPIHRFVELVPAGEG